jgi:hypothetical protein
MGLLLVAMMVALIKGWRRHAYFWAVFFLLQAQSQIGSAFARTRKLLGTGARLRLVQGLSFEVRTLGRTLAIGHQSFGRRIAFLELLLVSSLLVITCV